MVNIYRPPASDMDIFDSLALNIENLKARSEKSAVLLVGDFNCHHNEWLVVQIVMEIQNQMMQELLVYHFIKL